MEKSLTESWQRFRAEAEKAKNSGNLPEAESLYFAALQEAEQFPEGDPRLTVSLESLAEFYWTQHKHAQAEALCRRILKIYEAALGKDHIDVAILANNLAMLCHLQKKYVEAESLYKQTLSIKTRELGSDHPDVIKVLENYANLLTATHRAAEAEHLKVCAQSVTNGRWRLSGTWKTFKAEDNDQKIGLTPAQSLAENHLQNVVDVIDDEEEFGVSELTKLDAS